MYLTTRCFTEQRYIHKSVWGCGWTEESTLLYAFPKSEDLYYLDKIAFFAEPFNEMGLQTKSAGIYLFARFDNETDPLLFKYANHESRRISPHMFDIGDHIKIGTSFAPGTRLYANITNMNPNTRFIVRLFLATRVYSPQDDEENEIYMDDEDDYCSECGSAL